MKNAAFVSSLVLVSHLALPSVTTQNAWASSGNDCALISGSWIAKETVAATCEAAGERESIRETDSSPVQIKQTGCNISYHVPGTPASRSGKIKGNKLQMTGPFLLVPRGVSVSENTIRISGTVKGYTRINVTGKARAKGEYDGVAITCTGSSVATFTRPNDLLLDLRVDANRDQTVSFSGPTDQTTTSRPYAFWVNDDDDVALEDCKKQSVFDVRSFRKKHGCERLSDEKEFTKDANDQSVDHIRDLEDFARLQFKTNTKVERLLSHGYTLAIDTSSGLAMQFLPAVNTRLAYLKDSQIANAQRRQPFVNASDFGKTKRFAGRVRAVLFEGRREGKGTVQAILRTPGGSRAASSNKVHINLLPVRKMYEEAVATPQTAFPPPYDTLSPYNPLGPTARPSIGFKLAVLKHNLGNEEPSYILFVHGCCTSELGVKTSAGTAFKRLWWTGYRGRFGSFRWPAISGKAWPAFLGDTSKLRYNESEFRAYKYAEALKGVIDRVRSRLPGYSILLLAHSQGNVIASEALLAGATVDDYVMTQAAVGADLYDPNEQLRTLLSTPNALRPAPYSAAEGGPLGRFLNIGGSVRDEIVNMVNPVDYALRFWDGNNARKPDEGLVASLSLKGAYLFDPNNTQATFRARPGAKNRATYLVEDGHEMLSFLGRSKTKAVGREERARGPIRRVVNLKTRYGVGNSPRDHSAQFTRSVHYIYGYYDALVAEARR